MENLIENSNVLSKEFTAKSLLMYAIPSIVMMVFMSLYTTVDGFFISNFINEEALGAVNITTPFISFAFGLGFMFSSGSNALISKWMGEGKIEKANSFFSFVYILITVLGIILAVIAIIFAEPILQFLGSTTVIDQYSKPYFIVYSIFIPMMFLQFFANSFLVTAGNPKFGMILSLSSGITNMVLDWVFIAVLGWGIGGAAFATGLGYTVSGVIGILYFIFNKKTTLKFKKPKFKMEDIVQTIFNGSSEFVGNLSGAITTFLFNLTLLKFAGAEGLASITVISYLQFIQLAVYFGYSFGISPIISYKFGEKNSEQLKKIVNSSFRFISIVSLVVLILSFVGADFGVSIFIDSTENSTVFSLAKQGLRIFSISFLFSGFNIFITSMFTALNNGKISAITSILRSLVFLSGAIIILPQIFGITGVWIATPVAELLSFIVSMFFFKKYKKQYNY